MNIESNHGCTGNPCTICFPPARYVFPQDEQNTSIPDKFQRHGGLELRDYFAAQAMPMAFQWVNEPEDMKDKAVRAYAMADAMLFARFQTSAKREG